MRRKTLKTSNAVEVRRALSRVVNMVLNDEIDTKAANTIILGCNAILNSLRTDEQDKKIMDLEQLVMDKDE